MAQKNDHTNTDYRMEGINEMTQFLLIHRIEELQSCFNKHEITMNDLMMWTKEDARQYCIENKFETYIKVRLINALNKLQSGLYGKNMHSISLKLTKLQQKQLQSQIYMQNCLNKIMKELNTIETNQAKIKK